LELSRSLLNLAERDGRASYLSSQRGGGYDIAAPLEKIDPEPSVALGFPCGGHDDSRGALREIRGAERGHEHVQLLRAA